MIAGGFIGGLVDWETALNIKVNFERRLRESLPIEMSGWYGVYGKARQGKARTDRRAGWLAGRYAGRQAGRQDRSRLVAGLDVDVDVNWNGAGWEIMNWRWQSYTWVYLCFLLFFLLEMKEVVWAELRWHGVLKYCVPVLEGDEGV